MSRRSGSEGALAGNRQGHPARRAVRQPGVALSNRFKFARKLVQPYPALVALRRDVELSVHQAAARRLTAA